MITINSDEKICTLINVFKVAPEKHLELFNVLKKATEGVMCKLPGYISANIHISDDKTTVTNYAQWRSLEDFQNIQQHKEAAEHMKTAASIADSFEPHTYSTIWQHEV